MNYLYAAIAAIVYTVGSISIGWYARGTHDTVKTDSAVIKQEVANDTKRLTDQSTVAVEAKTYETATDPALDPIAAPVVRLCQYKAAPIVPSANPTRPGADASPPVRAPDPPNPVPSIDIGRPLVQISHNADAQVAGLQDYIQRVCLVEK